EDFEPAAADEGDGDDVVLAHEAERVRGAERARPIEAAVEELRAETAPAPFREHGHRNRAIPGSRRAADEADGDGPVALPDVQVGPRGLGRQPLEHEVHRNRLVRPDGAPAGRVRLEVSPGLGAADHGSGSGAAIFVATSRYS